MTKLIIITIVVSLFALNLFSQNFAVDSTRTMNEAHLSAIRGVFETGSDLAGQAYWQRFISATPSLRDPEDLEEPTRNNELLLCKKYSKEALWGAVGIDMPVNVHPSEKLQLARDFLLEDDPSISTAPDYLSLDSVWVNLDSFELNRIVVNTALIVDMLWYFVSENDRDLLSMKLSILADSLYYLSDRYKDTWGH